MKKILTIFAFTLIAALYFTSCEPDTESYTPQERMAAFLATANTAQWSALKQHTHPAAAQYNEADDVFWETRFDSIRPLINLSVTGTTATFTDSSSSTELSATLLEDGEDNYKIQRIEKIGVSPPWFY